MLSTGISKNPCICLIERDRGTQRVRDTVSYIIGWEGGEVGEQKMGNGVGAESVLCTGGRKEGRKGAENLHVVQIQGKNLGCSCHFQHLCH